MGDDSESTGETEQEEILEAAETDSQASCSYGALAVESDAS